MISKWLFKTEKKSKLKGWFIRRPISTNNFKKSKETSAGLQH